MAALKTNYVDDVLNASVNDKRKYRMVQNADGTVSFDDVTTYTQNGDSFGAKDINDTNTAVNVLNENLKALKIKFLKSGVCTDTVTLPSNFSELWIKISSGDYRSGILSIPYDALSTSSESYFCPFHNQKSAMYLTITETEICFNNGSINDEIISNSNFNYSIYYR